MSYTLKNAVVDKYLGDNKINNNMRAALAYEYDKYQLYKFDSCRQIMEKAMDCRNAIKFIKYAEQLEFELDKQFELWKVLAK